jgi:16S rRNA (uracil1498-N3)-methyltransferase
VKHVPHLVVGAPWPEGPLPVSIVQWRHLTKVLRLDRGDRVTYTDGLGRIGDGRLGGQTIERGDELTVNRDREITVVVPPPANKERQRFLVEKLAELGVARLVWLNTRHGKGRLVIPQKVFAWILAATEQSRGAWLMEASPGLIDWAELDGNLIVCDPAGGEALPEGDTVVIGPEGGWAEDEIPSGMPRWSLGSTILRTETAALVAAARMLGGK